MIDISTITIALYDDEENLVSAEQAFVNLDGDDENSWKTPITNAYIASIEKFLKNLDDAETLQWLIRGFVVAVFKDKEPMGQIRMQYNISEEDPTLPYPFEQ
jgi:hypothetical protein